MANLYVEVWVAGVMVECDEGVRPWGGSRCGEDGRGSRGKTVT
jgi:hypothetical protein